MSANITSRRFCGLIVSASVTALLATAPVGSAFAQVLSFMPVDRYQQASPPASPQPGDPDEATPPDSDQLSPSLRRQVVSYSSAEPPGTIIVDTAHTYLYLTLGNGRAIRYGIGVGRTGFTWSGVENISRKAEWPDWIPPAQMVARQPYLPRWVGGGPGNPLGARALYLGNTDYRIHGTNDPTSIGKHVSSGCIRLQNADVIDLFERVGLGTRVVVLANGAAPSAGRGAPAVYRALPSRGARPSGRVSGLY